MKKRKIFLSIVIAVLVLVTASCIFVACNDDDNKPSNNPENPSHPETVTITFDDGITTPSKTVQLPYNSLILASQIPNAAQKEGHTFEGWFYGEHNEFSIRQPNLRFTSDLTVHAVYKLNTVSVTFVNGTQRTKVSVKYGEKIDAEKVPTVNPESGKHFDGWFIDGDKEKEFEADKYVVKSDVEAIAMFTSDQVTVSFKLTADAEDAYKEVSIDYGTAIKSEDLPSNPDAAELYKFVGWFDADDEEAKFESAQTFEENKTFIAKFEKYQYKVTFKFAPEAERDDDVHKLTFDSQGNATLDFVPSASNVIGGRNFIGFFAEDGTKAVANMTLTDDVTFEALYIGTVDFAGAWTTADKNLVVYFDTTANRVKIGALDEPYTFDTANGSIKYSRTGVGAISWEFTIADGGLKAKMTDSEGTKNYTLTQGAKVAFAGSYVLDATHKFIVAEGGVVIGLHDTNYAYCVMAEKDGAYTIKFGNTTVNATIDAKNNIAIASGDYAGIWVKGSTAQNTYRNSAANSNLFTEHTVGSNKVIVVKRTVSQGEYEYIYATADKAFGEGEIVTVTLSGNNKVVIKIAGNNYTVAGDERGSYTNTDPELGELTIALDGFGKATLSGMTGDQTDFNGAYDYRMDGDNAILFRDSVSDFYGIGITLKNEGTFDTLEEDGKQGVYKDLKDGSVLQITLDGFGGVIARNGEIVRRGTYTVDEKDQEQNVTKITIAGIGLADDPNSQFSNGEYEFVQADIMHNAGTQINPASYWARNDATLNVEINPQDFVGYWTADDGYGGITYLEISLEGENLVINKDGQNSTDITKNADGTISFTNYSVYTLSKNGEVNGVNTLKLTWSNYAGAQEKVYSFTVAIPNEFVGVWVDDAGEYRLEISKSEVKVKLGAAAQLVKADYTLSDDKSTLTVNIGGVDYTVSFVATQMKLVGGSVDVTLAKAIITDAELYGTWKSSDGNTVLVVSSNSVSLNGTVASELSLDNYGDIAFTVDGNQHTFGKSGYYYKLDGETILELQKEFTGFPTNLVATWQGDNNGTTVTMVIEENAIVYDGTRVTEIEINSDDDYEFTINGVKYVLSTVFGGKLRVDYTPETDEISITFAVCLPDNFVGTWKSDDDTTIVIENNKLTFNGEEITAFKYTEDGVFTFYDSNYTSYTLKNVGFGSTVRLRIYTDDDSYDKSFTKVEVGA